MFKSGKFSILPVISILVLTLFVVQLIGFFVFDIVKVNERQVAVITRFGQIQDTRGPGWYFKIPWIEKNVTTYDTGVQSLSVDATSATKDQQTVQIKVNVQYHIDPTKAKEIYRLVRDQDYLNDSIVPPFIQESVKATSSKYTSLELLDKRDLVKTGIEEALNQRLKEYYATIVSVNLENIDWSQAFDQAIEQKVIAEQAALRKKQELEQAKIQAEIDITRARAEAEATKIQGEAIKQNPETLEKAKIDKWDGKLPQVQGSNNPIINLKP